MPSSEILMSICTWNWEISLVFKLSWTLRQWLRWKNSFLFTCQHLNPLQTLIWLSKIWLLESEMFSLLELETICKAQRIQHKVGCLNDVSSQEIVMLLWALLLLRFSSQHFRHIPALQHFMPRRKLIVFIIPRTEVLLSQIKPLLVCWLSGKDATTTLCALRYPSVLSARTGCTRALVPPAQPFLSSLFHTQSDGYLNPLLCCSKV